tara:strand:+ start:45496 stop:45795 length:300 start_codon:yes stop_codon:yes gene_type:complete
MPKNITLPVPLDRWFADAQRIEELREILGNTTLQEAITTLKEVAGPSYATVAVEDSANRARHAWYAGYRDAFNDLHKLTKFKQERPKQLEEWTHIQPNQ